MGNIMGALGYLDIAGGEVNYAENLPRPLVRAEVVGGEAAAPAEQVVVEDEPAPREPVKVDPEAVARETMRLHVMRIVTGLQSREDESLRLLALMELSQFFMGGKLKNRFDLLPLGPTILALSDCMEPQNKDQIRFQGARGLRFTFESIPSSVSMEEAAKVVPSLISAVENVTSIDVAEEGIWSLKLLVEEHAQIILEQGGVPACLAYLDFHSVRVQIRALHVVRVCLDELPPQEFESVYGSLLALAGRIHFREDVTIVSKIAKIFINLLDIYADPCPKGLKEILCSSDYIQNIIGLLSTQEVATESLILRLLTTLEKIASQFPETKIPLLQKYDILRCLMQILTRRERGLVKGVVGLVLQLFPCDELFENENEMTTQQKQILSNSSKTCLQIVQGIGEKLIENHNLSDCPIIRSSCLVGIVRLLPFVQRSDRASCMNWKQVSNVLATGLDSKDSLMVSLSVTCVFAMMEFKGVEILRHLKMAGVFHRIYRQKNSEIVPGAEIQNMLQQKCTEFWDTYKSLPELNYIEDSNTGDLYEELNKDSLKSLAHDVTKHISAFDILNSNLAEALLSYLTNSDNNEERQITFLNAFTGCAIDATNLEYFTPTTTPLSNLVEVLQHCLSQSYARDDFVIEFGKSSPQKNLHDASNLHETDRPTTSSKISNPTKRTNDTNLFHLLKTVYLLATNYANLLPPKLQLRRGLAAKSLPLLPPSAFVNEKISARLKFRMEGSPNKSVPPALYRFAKRHSFLLDLDTKLFIFYYEKLAKEKKTVTISRHDILSEAKRIMFAVKDWKPTMDIRYEEEEGFGQGPSLEFYTLVSEGVKKVNIWRHGEDGGGEFVVGKDGLFPKPIGSDAPNETELKEWFKFLGMFIGKAMYDRRRVDLRFSPAFYKLLIEEDVNCWTSLGLVDATLATSLHNLLREERDGGSWVDEMSLCHILPGYPEVELVKNGGDIPVEQINMQQYLELVCQWSTKYGVAQQIAAFKEGLSCVFPCSDLEIFTADELRGLFSGDEGDDEADWAYDTLSKHCKPDHGYTRNSDPIQWLYKVMSEFNGEERRDFLKFITGSPRLPVGGFRSLRPNLTIVQKSDAELDGKVDTWLPSVMTCANYLKLPNYSSLEILRERVKFAMVEGQFSFHLS